MKKYLYIAVAALTLAACSNEENESRDNWNGEIRLSSGVTVEQTRAMYNQDTQIKANEKVSVWVDDHSATDNKQLYGNNILTANGSGGFTGGTTMYYPQTGASVDIYTIHTNGEIGGTGFPATIIHNVDNDQTTAEKYAKSDLLYAIKKDQERQRTTVNLNFYHLLSKVEVALKSGAGSPDLNNAIVTIEGTKLKANFSPSKEADINNNNTTISQDARAAMVTLASDENEITPITIATKVSTNDFGSNTEYGEAIVVPQTIKKETPFIKVKLSQGGVLIYKIPEAKDLVLESGKKYTFNITVNLSSLDVTSSITDWMAMDAIDGEAGMEIPEN